MERTVVSEQLVLVGLNWTKLVSIADRTVRNTVFRVYNLTGDLVAFRIVEGNDKDNLEPFYGSEVVCSVGGVSDITAVWSKPYMELQGMANVPGVVKVEELAPDYALNPTLVSPTRNDVGER